MNVTQEPLVGARIGTRYLRHGQFVPEAAKIARRLSIEELEHPTRLLKLHESRQNLSNLHSRCLPCETELKRTLEYRLERISDTISIYENAPRLDNLPTLDPSFLSWKTVDGYPAFSIFPLDKDVMTISFTEKLGVPFWHPTRKLVGYDISIDLALPGFMARRYLDTNLLTTLELICDSEQKSGIELTAHYSGAMPDSTREKIHSWLDRGPAEPRFDEIYIVAEAPSESWEVKLIPKADPLVVGVSGGVLWLIDAFDLSPCERAVMALCDGSLQEARSTN